MHLTEENDCDSEEDMTDDETLPEQPVVKGNKQTKRTATDLEEPLNPPVKRAKQNLFKPPTNEELSNLKETENLFHSSLFRLQINELLSEVSIKKKWQEQCKDFVERLVDQLKSLSSREEHELSNQKWLKKEKVKIPIVQQPSTVKGKFQFQPPTQIHIIGSFPLATSVKPNVHVDLAVVMPKECIQNKDYLNQRYFRKRALFLACIAAQLRNWEDQSGLVFMYHCNNHMKPVLEVQPSGKLGSQVTVRIHIIPESGSFKLSRFHISKNNVRRQWFLQDSKEFKDVNFQEEEDELIATPNYNTSVLEDLTLKENFDHIVACIHGLQGIPKGIQLLKVWLHQRQLDTGYGSFSGFIMTMYVTYLLQNGKLNRMMSSYQVLRNTLIYLSQVNWNEEGISLCVDQSEQMPTMQEFHEHFSVVFIDPSGYGNLCAHMMRSTLERVKHEAKLAIELMATTGVESYDVLFMKPAPFMRKFDQVVHLSTLSNLKEACMKLGLENKLLDHCGDYVHSSLGGLMQLLDQAVGKRVTLTDVRFSEPLKWATDKLAPSFDSQETLSFGMLLDPDTYQSILEKGPPADTLEANKFRSFWGDKSELRRFQDGSICEAVVWACKTLADKRKVIGKCIKHILNRHCDIPRNTVTIISNQLDDLLRLPKKKKSQSFVYGTGEEQHLEVIRTYDELCKQIRTLRDLPLTINTIQGTSAVFRYAEAFPPVKATYKAAVEVKDNCSYPLADKPAPPYTPAISIICLLEGSGKWPEDLEAVRRIKAAYNLKLSSMLEGVHNLVTNPTPTFVDVLKNGYVFRLEVGCIREIGLAKLTKTPDGLVKSNDTEESLKLERKLIAVPKMTSTLHGIQQQYGSFCGSVCLAKRWVASHMMLGEHVPEEAIELIVAHIFLSSAPFTAPCSPQVGFCRFLYLLSTWDWKSQPLLVNLNNQFTVGDYAAIQNKFNKERSTLPLMFISTPDDKSSILWTKRHPTAPVLSRLVLLAKESLEVLQTQLEATHLDVDFKQIFRPPLEVFDVLIHLNHEQVCRLHHAVDFPKGTPAPEYTDGADVKVLNGTMPVMDYDPVQCYVKELRAAYDDLALFFCDKYGGSVIAVLWKPHGFKQKSFKVSQVNAHMLKSTDKDVELMPNVEAILQDFSIIGEGLVKNIESKSEKWTI